MAISETKALIKLFTY